ncbi:hypothetical protein G3R49_19355 [Shewanella sp. WXL01]|uniref:antA/AntB antirepressor family protein n=1 Tax=Shewanella sp. WXL01 TaxID=2709721 RepID=UPI0014385EBA|nr:antA/AntB antirepressor family protein [Shewanella sp. WXL01]NKF52717.1 hypothetical protein [Shewanella sp. WXL01]
MFKQLTELSKTDLQYLETVLHQGTEVVNLYKEKLPILAGIDSDVLHVDARSLHKQLETEKGFKEWVDGLCDFVTFEKYTTDRLEDEYVLCVDSAKQVSMLEDSVVGDIVRTFYLLNEKYLNYSYEKLAAKRQAEPSHLFIRAVSKGMSEEDARKLVVEVLPQEGAAFLATL